MVEVIDMRKVWKLIGILLVAMVAIGTATACSYGYGNSNNCQNYTSVNTEDLRQEAEELLQSVNVEEKYSYRYDTTHYILLKDDKVVGIIWKSVDINDLSIGSIIQTNWGAKAELIYNGEVVGQLYVEGSPMGWQNPHGVNNCPGCCGNGYGYGIHR